jgi:protocatechuate 3,4-dioxygenase beta subunit
LNRRVITAAFVAVVATLALPAIASAYTVSGNKFVDNNGDGVDAGAADPGLNGVTIYADINGNDVFDAGEPSATTTGTGGNVGNYTLTVANNSAYTIREVTPSTHLCSTPGTLSTDNPDADCEQVVGSPTQTTNVTGVNFGNAPLPLIAGTKFNDANANGVQDAGEGPLAGVVIYLDTNNDNIRQTGGGGEPSTTTSSTGKWAFTNLAPGNYTVREVPGAGTACTKPSPNFAECEFPVTLAAGQASVGNSFGNTTTGAITGTKFEDNNADGVRDNGEGGLSGVTIYADVNDNDARDAGEPSTTTAGNGSYTLNVIPGGYTIREELPAGYECSVGTIGDFDTCEREATVAASGTSANNNFGNFRRASISGLKFNDPNGNGTQDVGEDPIAGVTIYLDGSNGRPANDQFDPADPENSLPAETSTTTDASGNYSFTNLLPGNYTVREVPPTGTLCTFPGGTDASCEYNFTPLASGVNSTGNNFGNSAPGSISGTKFEDLNANGSKDGDEGPLANVTIYVDANDNDALDTGEASTTTDALGNWTLNNIPAGTRTVREVQPTDYTCTAPGTVGNFATCEFSVPVIGGETATGGYDFGNAPLPKISGTKFDDLDADGTDDGGTDPPLSGVTIYLDLNDNDVRETGQNAEPSTTTDANGNYSFSVAPGTYTVREQLPNNSDYVCSTPGAISNDDPDADCEHTGVTVTLGGADATGNDFGNFLSVSIAGTKFHDLNANGSMTGTEPGLSGWTIYLDGSNGRPANDQFDPADPDNNLPAETSTTTDAEGDYEFTGLLPGNYTVREDPQTDWHCSTPGTISNDSPDADCEHNLSLTSGTNATSKDFGNFQFASVSGTKYDDQNFNKIRDAGEPGLPGVTIYLDLNGNNAMDSGAETNGAQTTDADGNWSFTSLVPGSYTEREVEPAGYLCSAPSTNFAQCEFSQTLASGDADTTGQNFGNVQSATFSGTKFNDANANGVNDGEGPLSGVTIYLDANNDDVFDAGERSTTTDASGTWSIDGLYPAGQPGLGTYTAREVVPSGYECTAPSTDPALCEFTETLAIGQNSATGHDFGNHLIPTGGGGGGGGGGGAGGGAGTTSDNPSCGGKQATIVGTGDGEKIVGTGGADVIFAGGGADRVNGGGGKDVICGAAGKDTLKGGAGSDKLNGGAGKDKLVGGAGKDLLKGAGGADTCSGGGGTDKAKSCSSTSGLP